MADPVVTNILKSGAICWYAPAGTAFPNENSVGAGVAWGGNWKKLGFTKEPVKLAYEDEEHEIEVEEFLAAVGRVKIGEKGTLETVLSELTADYLQLGVDGTVTTTAAGPSQVAKEELVVGNVSKKTQYVLGFEGIRYDATGNVLPIRVGFYICTLHLNGELKFSRRDDDHTGVPLQAQALGDPANSGRVIWFQRTTAPHS